MVCKKSRKLLSVLMALAVLILCVTGCGKKTAPAVQYPAVIQTEAPEKDTLPAAPVYGDILEDSDYSDGTPRRRVSDFGSCYVTDYRPDGTVLREVTFYDNNGADGGKRVTNCDAKGNPTDTTETMPDGTLWLYLYYENTYDAQGRPMTLIEYNRMGFPLRADIYEYFEDGTSMMAWEEYRGPVYEYDFETDPAGETVLFSYGYVTYDAEGNVVDQMIQEVTN